MKTPELSDFELLRKIPPTECTLLDEICLQALVKTPWRFGTLQFFEPRARRLAGRKTHSPHRIATWMHEVQLVFHPERGVVLLRRCPGRQSSNPSYLREIRRHHRELADLQRKIRSRLDLDPFWQGRAIVLGIGLVLTEQRSPDQLSRRIPAPLIINATDLNHLPAALERLFEFHTTPATTPVSHYGPRLIKALTHSAQMGRFFDESAIADCYNELYRQCSVAA